MLVIVQVVGALLVLAPFAAHQFGNLNTDALGYRANLLARPLSPCWRP